MRSVQKAEVTLGPLEGSRHTAYGAPGPEFLIDSTSVVWCPEPGISNLKSPCNTDAAGQDHKLRTSDCVKVSSLPGSLETALLLQKPGT